VPILAFSQSQLNEAEEKPVIKPINTWLDSIIESESGVVKLRDYKFDKLKHNSGSLSSCIRKVSKDNKPDKYYLVIDYIPFFHKSFTCNAYFSYDEIVKLNTIISKMRDEVVSDFRLNPDYIENKTTKSKGNNLGYIIEDEIIKWFLHLEEFPMWHNDYYFSFEKEYILYFKKAQTKIESLMAGN
jgi:hypothetical protein